MKNYWRIGKKLKAVGFYFRGDDMKEFYRLWYTDSGNCYTYKDFDEKEEAIKEAQEISKALVKYTGNDGNTKLEKFTITIEQIDYNH